MKSASIALLLIATSAFAADHREAAKAALPTLGALAKLGSNTAGLTQAESAKATVDPGIRVMYVGLRDLRKYDGGDPHKLLIDAQTTLHGVRVGGVLRSEVTIADTPRGPRPVEIAHTSLIQRFEKARGPAQGGEFLVHVLALNSFFVARDVRGTLTLTPMHDMGELKMGKPVDAKTALRALAKEAQRIGDDDLT
jgi:hypothetical protein